MDRTELKIEYDSEMKPVSASCTACGEQMPLPPAKTFYLNDSADTIVWFSEVYIEHRKRKHSQDDRRRMPRD